MLPPLLFEIPSDLQAKVASGVYRQVGALILNPATGRIVKHLQQTGLAQEFTGHLICGLPNLLSPISMVTQLASAAVTYSQNRAILQGIEMLKILGSGGLILSGLDLGVSLAGFAVTSAKLDRLNRSMSAMDSKLDQIGRRVEDLHDAAVHNDFLALEAVCKQVDDGWMLADPMASWSSAADALYGLQGRFMDRARRGLAFNGPGKAAILERVEGFVDAVLLASSTLISVRTAMGDLTAARVAADRISRDLNQMTAAIGLREVLAAQIEPEGQLTPAGRIDALERLREPAQHQAQRFRLREVQAGSAGPILQDMMAAGVDGRAWLAALRSERRSPFVLVSYDTTNA